MLILGKNLRSFYHRSFSFPFVNSRTLTNSRLPLYTDTSEPIRLNCDLLNRKSPFTLKAFALLHPFSGGWYRDDVKAYSKSAVEWNR